MLDSSGVWGGLSGFFVAGLTALGFHNRIKKVEDDCRDCKDQYLTKDVFGEFKEGLKQRLDTFDDKLDKLLEKGD
jgi:hypothetical protein